MVTSIITIILAGIGAFLGSYLRKKGENFATKEDIGKITKIQEEIKLGNQIYLENMKAEIQKTSNLFNTTISTLSIGHQAFSVNISEAIKELWKCTLDLDKSIIPLASVCDLCSLLPEEQKEIIDNAKNGIGIKNGNDILIELNAIVQNLNIHRVFLNDELFTSFMKYYAFVSYFKMRATNEIKNGKYLNIKNDKEMSEIILNTMQESLISKIYENPMFSRNCSTIYQQVILSKAQQVITGKEFTESSILHAINLSMKQSEINAKKV